MLRYDFENSVGHRVIQAAHLIERAVNAELAPHGITYPQCQVLGWLAHDGELNQCELAARMRIEPPTLAGILDRMEKRGWVERVPSATDRRKKIVRPGETARPVWNTIVQCAHAVRARAVRGLSPEQIRVLFETLDAIQHNLSAPEAEPWTDAECP